MTLLTKNELRTLIEKRDGSFVSIFMPARQAGPETRENPIRFKNLVSEAEEQLIEKGVRAPEARELLEPAQELIDNYDFWQKQDEGLAVFISPDMFRTYQLPLEFDSLTVVGNRFHIKPLLPLLSGDGQFYLLAVSQNKVRLFQGTRYTVHEIELEDVPQSLAEALQYEEPLSQQQFHTSTATPAGRGGRPAVFHGHGVGTDDQQEDILEFFQQLDKGLQPFLESERTPLVLAGVEFLFPIYQEANTYPVLMEKGVTGNPDEMSAQELHEKAWEIMQPYFQQARNEAISRYKDLTATDQVSQDIKEIVPAAHYSRVEVLFVATGLQQWGRFEPDTNTLHFHEEAEPGDEDLLDSAAGQTVINGGTVYAMDLEKMPDNVPLAAIFRYAK